MGYLFNLPSDSCSMMHAGKFYPVAFGRKPQVIAKPNLSTYPNAG
jgi:hypothetical protein